MPKSDSDITTNASLTSDGEDAGSGVPAASTPQDGSAAVQTSTSVPVVNARARIAPTAAPSNNFNNHASQPNGADIEEHPKPTPFAGGSASARWRASAKRVIQMNKSTAGFKMKRDAPGAEPGADPKRPSANEHWFHIHEECSIQVVDYSATRANFLKADNQGLILFLTTSEGERPPWSKARWINVGGISWDVISALALKYDLHPLAVEDVLHSRRTSMSKADYYAQHLFISALLHTVQQSASADASVLDGTPVLASVSTGPLTAAPGRMTSSHSTNELPQPATASQTNDARPNWLRAHLSSRAKDSRPKISHSHLKKNEGSPPDDTEDDGVNWILESIEGPEVKDGEKKGDGMVEHEDEDEIEARAQAAHRALVNELKGEDRVVLDVTNLYIFLLRDGTVISIYKKPEDGHVFGAPILRRLRDMHTLLRRSHDPSLLLQAILDFVVDKALEVVDRYHERILRLERSVLIHPKMPTVREMHVLSGDLTLHKRTLAPIKSLIYGLRRYDLDRCKALVTSSDPNAETDSVKGFLSHQARVYLADVNDHMDYVLESMDMFGTIAENLISYVFNSISYQTNETMRRLSLATIIFFPLTFLTGYCGMNFENFRLIRNSDLVFWEIALPMMFVFMVVWLWNDITRIGHTAHKRFLERRYHVASRLKTRSFRTKKT